MADLKRFKVAARIENGKPVGYMIGGRPGAAHKWVFAELAAKRIIDLGNELADLERQLAEAKKLAQWTPITPHNLPKVGWEVGRTSANDPLGPYNVRGVREVSQMLVDTCRDMDTWIFYGYRVTRPINPPQPEKPSMKSTREIIATNWFGASQPEKEKP
jgi:hypothetical protein